MANGFFLGGVAKGMDQAKERILKERTLEQNQSQFDQTLNLNKSIEEQKAIREKVSSIQAESEQFAALAKEAIANARTPDAKAAAVELGTTTLLRFYQTVSLLQGENKTEEDLASKTEEIGTFLNSIPSAAEANQYEIQDEIAKKRALDEAGYGQKKEKTLQEQYEERAALVLSETGDVDPKKLLQSLNVLPADKESSMSARDSAIQNMVDRGYNESDAKAVYDKFIIPVKDPETDQTKLYNLLSGNMVDVNSDQPQQQPQQPQESGRPASETALGAVATDAVGAGNVIGQAASQIPVVGDIFYREDRAIAKQTLNLFNEQAVQAFIKNGKFPQFEVEALKKILPKTDSFFQTEKNAKAQLLGTKKYLENLLEQNSKIVGDKNTSSEERKDAMSRVNTINGVLEALGTEEDYNKQKLPEGADLDKEIERLKKELGINGK